MGTRDTLCWTMVNMYSTCGDIDEAQVLFDGVRVKDVSTYDSMIGGV